MIKVWPKLDIFCHSFVLNTFIDVSNLFNINLNRYSCELATTIQQQTKTETHKEHDRQGFDFHTLKLNIITKSIP